MPKQTIHMAHPRDVAALRTRKHIPNEGEKLTGISVRKLREGVDPHSLDEKFPLPGRVDRHSLPFRSLKGLIMPWVCTMGDGGKVALGGRGGVGRNGTLLRFVSR